MKLESRKKLAKVLGVVLLAINIIGVWCFWEDYKTTVNWSLRSKPFPSPFYLWYWPNAVWIDFAITLIVFSALGLAILVEVMD